jgi:rubrerythrin
LDELIEAKGKVDIAKAAYKADGAVFDLIFAKAASSVKAQKEVSVICLECGTVYRRGRPCPTCPEEAPAA